MAGGLFALLDDVAALARIAAASVDDVGDLCSAELQTASEDVGPLIDRWLSGRDP